MAAILALLAKSIVVTSFQPTFGMAALCRCMVRAALRLSSISNVYASVPSPTNMPFSNSFSTGEQPTALPMLDSGLFTTIVPVSRIMSISAGLICMQCPSSVLSPKMPLYSRRFTLR